MTEETETEEKKGGSFFRKLVGMLAIFGAVFAAVQVWRRRGRDEESEGEGE